MWGVDGMGGCGGGQVNVSRAEDVEALGQEACPTGLYSPEPHPAPCRTPPANLNRPEQVPWVVSTLPRAAGWPLFHPSRHQGVQR